MFGATCEGKFFGVGATGKKRSLGFYFRGGAGLFLIRPNKRTKDFSKVFQVKNVITPGYIFELILV